MRFLSHGVLLAIASNWALGAAAEDEIKNDPCTIQSLSTGSFFDLNGATVKNDTKKGKPDETPHSWKARGYDYGANFTMNFCAPVIEDLQDVVDISKKDWGRIAGYYEKGGKTYSLGFNNSELLFRGKTMVMNFTGGSECKREGANKFTLISFLCEKEPTAPTVSLSFVGADPDECSYTFQARTSAACATSNTPKQTVGPSSVFGIIAVIAILVYLVGGIVYQRTVMHQRGWRQLPNYVLWSGMVSFIKDMVVILFSSCTRCIPGRKRGYNRLNGGMNGYGGRGHNGSANEDENRLIDEIDEEY